MAIPFLNNLDISNNQLLNAKLQITGTAPNAAAGQIYFDSTVGDETAKYYSNVTDTWVSLKEYSFPAVIPANGYVTSTVAGTVPKPIITFDLNAVDGVAAAGERYLTKTNLWAEISTIPGTYNWTLQGNTGGPTAIPSASAVSIIGGDDLETTLVGTDLTVDLKVGPGIVGTSDNYVFNQSTAVADADDSIPFNSYTPGGNPPSTQVNVVKKTTLGTIPVTALTLVKTYIDESVTGLLQFIGGFNANTGDLDSPLTTNLYTNTALAVGDLYVVSTAGNFFGNAATPLTPGDSVIVQTAAAAGAAVEADFIVVQSDTDLATLATVGIGNVNTPNTTTELNILGTSVTYSAGTATVGLDIDGLAAAGSRAATALVASELELPVYNSAAAEVSNQKLTVAQIVTLATASTSKAGTITAGSLSGTVAHDFGINTLVQTINSSGDTVFCDVTRTATTSVATIAVAEATDITILVQKIG